MRVLVTGAAGSIGSVGRSIVELLTKKQIPVRALVHRVDERSKALSDMGAEVVVADLTKGDEVVRAMEGCSRIYFGMSVSPPYLEATVLAAAAAKELGNCEVFVNISQLTVSQMDLRNMTESPQQRQHWMAEQVLNWSGLPVVHVRATIFLQHPFFTDFAAESIGKDGTIRLPFGSGRTSPISAFDVARVAAAVLESPAAHIGKVYELTGPRSQNMKAIAHEYEEALGRKVEYIDMPFEQWCKEELNRRHLPEHVSHHFEVMAKLHSENRYDRLTDDVAKVTGTPAMSIRDYVAGHPEAFKNVATQRVHN